MNGDQKMAVRYCCAYAPRAILFSVFFMSVMTIGNGLLAQSSAANTSSKSDPNALALLTKALNALGGATKWQNIGAATAQVELTKSDGVTETIQWADDWHLGYVRARRDSKSGTGQTATMITGQYSRIRNVSGSGVQTLPRENDLTMLSEGYPGASLLLSLQKTTCRFNVERIFSLGPHLIDKVAGAGNLKVQQICRDPFAPTGMVQLTWIFSASTGLPIAVRSAG